MSSKGLIERLESRVLLSVAMVKDVNTSPRGNSVYTAVEMNGKVYFAFDDGTSGPRLWSSDGTREGTKMVTNAAVAPANLVNIGGTLYFGTPGVALWKSDGTAQGTVMLAKMWPNNDDDSASDITGVGDTIFFTAGRGGGLYKFDPVTSVASYVGDIFMFGTEYYYDPELTNLNGTLYYTAWNGAASGFGHELWRTDGTPEGTRVVKDIMPGLGHSQPSELTAVGDKLYFRASSPQDYGELWQTDGTEAGTVRVKDLVSAFPDSPTKLTEFKGVLYFNGRTQAQGYELWRTDGTPGGTQVVKDISPGVSSSHPGAPKVVGDSFYFLASVQGQVQLWKSDGTTEGTQMVKVGPSFGGPSWAAVGDTLYFTAGHELWKSDGTEGGTHLVLRPGAYPQGLAPLGDRLFFSAAGRPTFWTTDGTPAGIREVRRFEAGSRPSQLMQLSDGAFVFAADDGTTAGRRSLWRSDGTAGGTIKLSDVVPHGWEFARIDDTLFFFVAAGTDRELWKTDGTPEGTMRVKDMRLGLGDSEPVGLVAAGDRVFFRVNDRVLGVELWTSDGTPDGTYMVKETVHGFRWPEPVIAGVIGNVVYFKAEDRLWKSDGTPEGTVLVKDINLSEGTGLDWLTPLHPFTYGGYLYFMGRDDEHGRELWRSDGTAQGTGLVSDLMVGNADSVHYASGVAGGRLYTVSRDAAGVGLWRYDASGSNPTLVRRLDDRGIWSVQLNDANGLLVFTMWTPESGVELWRSDGTEAGTFQIKDINPGAGYGVLDRLTRGPDGAVYFWADDGTSGVSLWKSDGSAAGTVPLPDTYPGLGSAGYFGIGKVRVPPIFLNGRMYFAASDGEHGVELWQYAKPGDANRDFRVGFEDLVIVAQNYNGTNKTHDQGDFTGDGRTDFQDLVVLAQNYSAPPSGPVSAALAARSREAERKSLFSMTAVTKRPPPKRARVQ